ncbi:MAG: hypothetical protein K2X80_03630 [Pseudomonadaceae bacterium]|nr:hypothetical protein [Pseudomonadaceae bacterium]
MDQELMTAAICWEIGAKVSVDFAYKAKELFYFCPEANCLAEVIPAKIKNAFFRAPESHAPGCVNEKKKTTDSPVPTVPVSRKTSAPPQAIPTHLGPVAKARKGTKPSAAQMHALALQSRLTPPLHPGTFQEVVDAWCSMHAKDRHSHPLYIAFQPHTYFDAFSPFSHVDKDEALNADHKIVYGQASVSDYNHSFYVTTRSKFRVGERCLPIKIRVRANDAHYAYLKDGQDIVLFLHGAIPTLEDGQKYIEIQPADTYSGMVIKRGDFSSLAL